MPCRARIQIRRKGYDEVLRFGASPSSSAPSSSSSFADRVGSGVPVRKGVKLRRDKIVVALENKVYVYNFADLQLVHQIETTANPKGSFPFSPSPHYRPLSRLATGLLRRKVLRPLACLGVLHEVALYNCCCQY
jgi:hypothetical protein